MDFRELRYISNLLSLSRIVLAMPIFYLLKLQTPTGNYLATLVMLIAAFTDLYDGKLARRLKQQSDLGRVLDPIADKICIGMIVIMLLLTRDLPLWFVAVVVGRDLAILVLAFFVSVKKEHVVESNMLGKVTVTALGFTVIAFTLEIPVVKEFLMWSSVALIAASSVSYFFKFMQMSKST